MSSRIKRTQTKFSTLEKSENLCRSRDRLKLFCLFFTWIIIIVIYMLIYGNPFGSLENKSPLHVIQNISDINPTSNREIIFSNIAIVIPSHFNEYTLKYLERLLDNIYLSQIDFEPDPTSLTALYFPSEVIISMSISAEYYQYEEEANDILHYYISTILKQQKYRLRIFYHHNITMNAAQNRNFGLSQIDYSVSQYIGFFDMDDIMHPQRIGILHHVLNANANEMDMVFHSFSMHKECKEDDIEHDYLNDFVYLNVSEIASVSQNIRLYDKNICVAYYEKARKGLAVFDIICNDGGGANKIQLEQRREAFVEIIEFDRFYHRNLSGFAFINYTQLIDARCMEREYVKHPVYKKGLKDVACEYGTMAGGLEAFRNEEALTRHHNGWPTMTAAIAKKLKYDENWFLHGSTRGQDAGFNTEVYKMGANIFQIGFHLGMYCH